MRIYSYFSLPTDLAGAMHNWPEFVSGEDYDIELKNDSTDEAVSVKLIERGDDGQAFIRISGNRMEKIIRASCRSRHNRTTAAYG